MTVRAPDHWYRVSSRVKKKSLAWIILFREWFWPAAAACIICGGRARIWMEKIEKQEIQKLHNIQFSHNVNSTDLFSTFYRTAAWIQQSNKLRNILMETAPGLLLMKTKFHLNRMCEKKECCWLEEALWGGGKKQRISAVQGDFERDYKKIFFAKNVNYFARNCFLYLSGTSFLDSYF